MTSIHLTLSFDFLKIKNQHDLINRRKIFHTYHKPEAALLTLSTTNDWSFSMSVISSTMFEGTRPFFPRSSPSRNPSLSISPKTYTKNIVCIQQMHFFTLLNPYPPVIVLFRIRKTEATTQGHPTEVGGSPRGGLSLCKQIWC